MDRPAWTLGILSFALLAFEVSLMRVLSYLQWYHFAYMIISVALLGFGASGTLLFLFRSHFIRRFEMAVAFALILCSLFMILSMTLLGIVCFDPYRIVWKFSEVWNLLYFYVVLFLPFLFGAFVIGLTFMKRPEQIGKLYFANLLGSGLGAVGAIPLAYVVHPLTVPLITAAFCVFALAVFLLDQPRRALTASIALLGLIFLLDWWHPVTPVMSQYKSLSKALLLPQAKIVGERRGPLGIVTALESPALRYAPGLSLSYGGRIPSQLGVFADGEWVGTIIDHRDTSAAQFLERTTSALPYRLKTEPQVLVLGAGTGSDVYLALGHSARSVTAVEMNSQLVELLRAVAPDRTDFLYERKNVLLRVEEARTFLAGSQHRFDLIVLPILEGFTASAAGMQALFENYLFTVDSFREMIDHLREDGILSITTWMNYPPRSSLKILATIHEALRELRSHRLEQQVAVIRSWGTVTLLAKRSPFNEEEIEAIRGFCEDNFFDLVYVPGIRPEEVNRFHQLEESILENASDLLLSETREDFLRDYQFFIAPAGDNRPYFSHFFKWKSLPYLREIYGTSGLPFFEWGYVILVATLVQLVILSLLLILVPLFFLRGSGTVNKRIGPTLFYFGGIGVGYMFVEVVMIQKFILLVGHPIYAVAVVVAGMLVFSGLGSYFSHRLASRFPAILTIAVISVVGFTTLYLFGSPVILKFFSKLPILLRFTTAILLLSPPAYLMGLLFPLGLERLSRANPALVPWAWGINGCASVASVILATFIAINQGFVGVLVVAGLSYVLALASFGSLGGRMVQS
ncbi:MAG: SAM-dependent methyltransferase [Bacteroidota bacterium]